MNKPRSKFRRQEVPSALIDNQANFNYVEAYRMLRTNLGFTLVDDTSQVIMVTSSVSSEGKSTIAINLSHILAQTDKKVLLIDADLRKPSIAQLVKVKVNVKDGLSTLLASKSTIESAVFAYKHLNFYVMLSGPIPPNATELLSFPKFGEVLKQLRQSFDYIIIDSPPVGIVTDAAVISQHVDGAIFVVRHNYANREVLNRALGNLKKSGVRLLGAVMNNYDNRNNYKSSAYDSYYYYSNYGSETDK